MTRSKLFLTALIGFSFLTLPALAQDKPAAKEDQPVVKDAPARVPTKANDYSTNDKPSGPVKDWIDAENALIDPLSDKDKESFFIMRNKYSVIRVIKVVEGDISNAVDSCGAKNPDMKDKMTKRFGEWKGAVDPIITTAKKQLDKDIDNQKIVDVQKARDVLTLNDKAYEFGDKKVIKTPVTTPEACQGLVDSMDRTEDEMITLLRQTLLPESVIRERNAKAKKDKAEQDKAAAAAEKSSKKEDTKAAPEKTADTKTDDKKAE